MKAAKSNAVVVLMGILAAALIFLTPAAVFAGGGPEGCIPCYDRRPDSPIGCDTPNEIGFWEYWEKTGGVGLVGSATVTFDLGNVNITGELRQGNLIIPLNNEFLMGGVDSPMWNAFKDDPRGTRVDASEWFPPTGFLQCFVIIAAANIVENGDGSEFTALFVLRPLELELVLEQP